MYEFAFAPPSYVRPYQQAHFNQILDTLFKNINEKFEEQKVSWYFMKLCNQDSQNTTSILFLDCLCCAIVIIYMVFFIFEVYILINLNNYNVLERL